jgi:L-rhamnose mutarotase
MDNIEKSNYTIYRRFCKTLELRNNPDLIESYIKAHSKGQAWPEITKGMLEVGILDMEIYIVENRLFMIMDTVPDFDHDKAMQELALKPRQSEWENFVSKFQNTSSDASANDKWEIIERIYKMGE